MNWKILAIAIAVPGCAVDDPHASTTTQYSGCSILSCSENAASAGDGLLFDEFNLAGNENYAKVRFLSAEGPDGSPVTIDIWWDELVAYNSSAIFRSSALVNTVMHFQHSSGTRFDVRVDQVNAQLLRYVAHDDGRFIPLYHLMARLADDPKKLEFEVCNHDPLTLDPSWTGAPHSALVFRGDKYDGPSKTVVQGDPWSEWAFIACNGSAASKMHLWRHTSAGAYDANFNETYLTTLDKRTTLLKAITADYCGNGYSFTENGTRLVFATADDPGAGPASTTALRSVEALWSPGGAACLDVTRRTYYGGYTRADIVAKCPWRTFDTCANGSTTLPPGWNLGRHVITANPW